MVSQHFVLFFFCHVFNFFLSLSQDKPVMGVFLQHTHLEHSLAGTGNGKPFVVHKAV